MLLHGIHIFHILYKNPYETGLMTLPQALYNTLTLCYINLEAFPWHGMIRPYAIDLLKLEAFLEELGRPEPWTPATSKSKDTIWNGEKSECHRLVVSPKGPYWFVWKWGSLNGHELGGVMQHHLPTNCWWIDVTNQKRDVTWCTLWEWLT